MNRDLSMIKNPDEFFSNSKWVLSSNQQIDILQKQRLQYYAWERNLPVLKWKINVKQFNSIANVGSLASNVDKCYQICDAYQYYVPTAPVNIKCNLNPARGIGNGVEGVLHEIFYNDDNNIEKLQSLLKDFVPGDMYEIEIPDYITLLVPPLTCKDWHSNLKLGKYDAKKDLVDDRQGIVYLSMEGKHKPITKDVIKKTTAMTGQIVDTKLTCKSMAYSSAQVVSFYNIQVWTFVSFISADIMMSNNIIFPSTIIGSDREQNCSRIE